MRDFHIKKQVKADPIALDRWCKANGWVTERLTSTLFSVGLSNDEVYLETPNLKLLDNIAEFMTITGSALFVIYGPNGMGKSALKEFFLRVFGNEPQFNMSSIDNPGPLQKVQFLRSIYQNLVSDDTKIPRNTDQVLKALETRLLEIKQEGKTTIIWIDEGQKLDIQKLGLLQLLADLKNPAGDLICKIIVVGTPDLKNKLIEWTEEHPEITKAFDNRSELYAWELEKWNTQHIYNWWTLLSEYCAKDDQNIVNPFDKVGTKIIETISEGKPRAIVQLTQIVINAKARACYKDKKESILISEYDIAKELKERFA